MSDVLEPVATSYATIQPSSAGAVAEGFTCTAIWAVLAASITVGSNLWHGSISNYDWATFVGAMLGKSLVLGAALSTVILFRRRKNITSYIFLDWRWWLACVLVSGMQKNALPWFWVTVIHEFRFGIAKTRQRPTLG
jgi:hypothetical protein